MLDVSVSYNRYKFLGYEFLTWLWFAIEKDQDNIRKLERSSHPLRLEMVLYLKTEKKMQWKALQSRVMMRALKRVF